LDEIEKAHPDVTNILLQMLEDGRLTDGQGRTVDFRHSIIVLTSNIGTQQIQDLQGEDVDIVQARVMDEVRKYFKPELINRIDDCVVFASLLKEQQRQILDLQIQCIQTRLLDQQIRLQVSDAAKDQVLKIGYDPVYGVRPLRRALQRSVENTLAKFLLAHHFERETTLELDYLHERGFEVGVVDAKTAL